MRKTQRLPSNRRIDVIAVAAKRGRAPRFALARDLTKRCPELSFKTALDYILAAKKEGILIQVGLELWLSEKFVTKDYNEV